MDATPASDRARDTDGDADHVLALINRAWITQVIRTACVLQVPDHLARGPIDTQGLAATTGSDPNALHRLLLAMTALELCESPRPSIWQLTRRGHLLRQDAPQSMHHWALHAGGGLWQRLGDLPDAVLTGRSWPERHHGVEGYERLAAQPQAQAVFDQAMVELTRQAAPALMPLLGLDTVRSVVDVGGGRGALLGAVLAHAPAARGVLYDRSTALQGAAALLEAAGVVARCRIEPGDFFAGVPSGAEVYLLKSVLHNWDDDAVLRILARCADAMPRGARLMVIERLRPSKPGHGARDREVARTDLNMLVSLSGRERGVDEYAQLMAEEGLRLACVRESMTEWSVLEARHDETR